MYAAGHGIKKLRATRAGGFPARARRAILVVGALLVAGSGFAVVAHGGPPRSETTVVVQPGDTLWSIAAEHYPSDDVRSRVDDIERANRLSGPVIDVGQTLVLPG